jgi:hypothetical protein
MIFVCSYCSRKVSRSFHIPAGISQPPRDVCMICHWLNTNKHLTINEREELRVKLCYDDDDYPEIKK